MKLSSENGSSIAIPKRCSLFFPPPPGISTQPRVSGRRGRNDNEECCATLRCAVAAQSELTQPEMIPLCPVTALMAVSPSPSPPPPSHTHTRTHLGTGTAKGITANGEVHVTTLNTACSARGRGPRSMDLPRRTAATLSVVF